MKERCNVRRLTWFALLISLTTGWSQQVDRAKGQSETPSPKADMEDFRAAMAAEPGAREIALRRLVTTAEENVATPAFMALIRLHTPGLESLGAALLSKLSEQHMANVLGAAERTRDIHFRLALARGALQRIADGATVPDERGGVGTAGQAARLLAESKNASDRDLIGRVAELRPYDPGVWLGLAKMGLAGERQISLARSVMQDARASRWARLAAAAALAPGDSSARTLVADDLGSFLTDISPQDWGKWLAEVMRQADERSKRSPVAAESPMVIVMIGILEFLQTSDAERLTFEFLDANNLFVREPLGVIAVMRWPDRFLALRQSSLRLEERTRLLAALSVFHPELLPRVQSMVSSEELEKLRAKMLDQGVGVVCRLAARAALVF